MADSYGKNIKVELFGSSHGPEMGAVISGLPAGIEPDMDLIAGLLERRAPGKPGTSSRKERDIPEITGGLSEGRTDGSPLRVVFKNEDARPRDYDELMFIPRPGHGDYTYYAKTGEFISGGATSARLTAPMVFAGALCLGELKKQGIEAKAHIAYSLEPEPGDTAGGIVECRVTGLPAGLGAPYFGKLESAIGAALFSVPALKGVEFGAGFKAASLKGSENNDAFYFEDGVVKTKTNNCGGVLGGMATGMPLVLRAAFKPAPSIAKEQETVNLKTGENVKISINGRHDPALVIRAVPVVEALVGLALYDVMLGEGRIGGAENQLAAERLRIDAADRALLEAFATRMDAAKKIGAYKKANGLAVYDPAREEAVIEKAKAAAGGELAPYAEELMKTLMELSKKYQEK